jgi:hypothetical protein
MSTQISYTKVVGDLTAKRGDTFRIKISFFTRTNGVLSPDDITASTFKMDIAKKADGTENIKHLTMASGLSITSPNFLIVLIAATGMNIAPGTYYYDIERTYPDGTVKTKPEGRFIVEADVTLPTT